MTTTSRAANGADLHPRNAIQCDRCHLKLAVNAIHNVLKGSTVVLCTDCVHHIPLHKIYYRQCPHEHHDLFDHGFTSCTRASARALIKERSTKR